MVVISSFSLQRHKHELNGVISRTEIPSEDGGRCVLAAKPAEPKYFYFGNRELPIGILVSGRLTHKLTSAVVKVFAEEVLGYCNVSLVAMEDPAQGFDPDAQFKYISSCTDPR